MTKTKIYIDTTENVSDDELRDFVEEISRILEIGDIELIEPDDD